MSRAQICERLRSPVIDAKETFTTFTKEIAVEENKRLCHLNYVTMKETEIRAHFFKEPRNRFKGIDSASLCSLAGQYDNPIPTQFQASIDCLKIQQRAQICKRLRSPGIDSK